MLYVIHVLLAWQGMTGSALIKRSAATTHQVGFEVNFTRTKPDFEIFRNFRTVRNRSSQLRYTNSRRS